MVLVVGVILSLVTLLVTRVLMCVWVVGGVDRDSVPVEYCGWECPDEFVVGYGMDFAGAYRCLPFVGVLKPEACTLGVWWW